MYNANAFTIRAAHESDEPTLVWLAVLASQPAVRPPALIGDAGRPSRTESHRLGRLPEDRARRACPRFRFSLDSSASVGRGPHARRGR